MRGLFGGALVALAACASPVEGSIGDIEFTAAGVVAKYVTAEPFHQITVVIGGLETSDLCRDLEGRKVEKNATYLKLDFGGHGALAEGDFAIGGTLGSSERFAQAVASKLDEACKDTLKRAATKGTITLKSFSDDAVSGSYELTFGDDTLTGSFSADTCESVSLQQEQCG